MAVVYVGAKGASWSAADWIARNALHFLRPALERAGLPDVAAQFAGDPERPPAFVDLGLRLELPDAAPKWERAIGFALAAIDAEAGAGWAEPQRFGAFRAAVARLAELAEPDGNALVVRLADATSKIFGSSP